jgi:hypothetical protein
LVSIFGKKKGAFNPAKKLNKDSDGPQRGHMFIENDD